MAEGTSGRRVALVLATSTGGVGRHVRSLAAHLADDGVDVRVYGPAATELRFGFTAAGAGFAPLEIAAGLRPAADLRAVARLRRLTADAAVVHAHGMRAGLVGVAANTGRQTPLVVTWHNVVLDHRGRGAAAKRAVSGALERAIARGTDLALCVSADLQARVHSLGGRDVRPGPIGAPALAAPVRDRQTVRAGLGVGDRPLILTVARLHPQKGLEVLLETARRLAGRACPPMFAVAGDGPLRASLQERIDRGGLPVRLLGARGDIPDLLAAADVVVLPSRWEARSLAAQEAMTAGRPFVGTAVGGMVELVGDGGVLVPPGDPEALAAAVSRLLDHPDEAAEMAERGRARSRDWPTERDTAAQVRAVYAELLGGSV